MKVKIFLIFLCFAHYSFAQQEPQFTMYWNNYSTYNPAASGIFNKHYAAANTRYQWVGFAGAPFTQTALYDRKIDKINSGIGLNYVYDQLGFDKSNKVHLNYAYHIKFKKERVLSAGVSFGFQNHIFDGSKLKSVYPNDPFILGTKVSTNYFNVNAGLMFKSKHLLLGISSTQLNASESGYYHNARHLYLLAQYTMAIGENFEIKPGIYVKFAGNSAIDINLRTVFKKKYWLGASYRPQNAICFMAGIDIAEKFRISYAYDYNSSSISFYSNGSHELGLALMLD